MPTLADNLKTMAAALEKSRAAVLPGLLAVRELIFEDKLSETEAAALRASAAELVILLQNAAMALADMANHTWRTAEAVWAIQPRGNPFTGAPDNASEPR